MSGPRWSGRGKPSQDLHTPPPRVSDGDQDAPLGAGLDAPRREQRGPARRFQGSTAQSQSCRLRGGQECQARRFLESAVRSRPGRFRGRRGVPARHSPGPCSAKAPNGPPHAAEGSAVEKTMFGIRAPSTCFSLWPATIAALIDTSPLSMAATSSGVPCSTTVRARL